MSSAVHGFLNPKGVALFGSMREGWFFGAGVVIKDLLDLGAAEAADVWRNRLPDAIGSGTTQG